MFNFIPDLKQKYPQIDWDRVIQITKRNREILEPTNFEDLMHPELTTFEYDGYTIYDPFFYTTHINDPVETFGKYFLNSGYVK